MRRLLILLPVALGLALALGRAPSRATAAVSGQGGLDAVAVSADGKLVAVGGQNRTVYLLTADTLEVQRRIWLGARVGGLAFSRDGSRLVVEDETDTLHLLEAGTGKALARQPNSSGLLFDPAGDQVIVRDLSDPGKARLRRLTTAKLDEAGRIELDDRAAAYRLDPAGKRLVVLSASHPGDERRVPAAEVPRELTGLARWTFRLKYDGLQSNLWAADLATGKVVERSTLWYTSDSESTVVVPAGKATYVLNRANLCARIAGARIDLYETGERLNHALGVSPDCKTLIVGGVGTGTYGPPEGGKRVRFDLEPLPGRAEVFTRFAVRPDGSAFGVTTAYRVVRLGRDGKVEKVRAVY